MMDKRLLLVSQHFGRSGTTGGFRWATTVDYLVRHGWRATIVTHDQPNVLELSDRAEVVNVPMRNTVSRIPAGVRSMVKRVRERIRLVSRRPVGHRSRPAGSDSTDNFGEVSAERLRARVDGLPLPSPRDRQRIWSTVTRFAEALDHLWWAIRAYRQVLSFKKKGAPGWDVVVVSSPPHWTQVCGMLVARRLGIPFVADMRDPWIAARPRNLALESTLTRVNRSLEMRMLRKAALVVFNTGVAQRLAHSNLQDEANPVKFESVSIGNGYDHDLFPASMVDLDKFRVVFAGFIYPHMDVRVLFRTFSEFVSINRLGPEQASLELIGVGRGFNGFSFLELSRAYDIEHYVELSPRVDRETALQLQARASVLLAMDYPYPSAVVMKAYDYLLMPGFILALTRPGSALSQMLEELGLEWFTCDDESAIVGYFGACYERWRNGEMQADKDPRGMYARERRSQEIMQALDALVSPRGAQAQAIQTRD